MTVSIFQKRIGLGLSGLFAAILLACGGGSPSNPPVKTGYFIDSPVEGLHYQSGSQSGYTNKDGAFQYTEGQTVRFSIGQLALGSLVVKNQRVFPVDLIDGALDETHPKVGLMAQILQTIDSDKNPSNGITITDETRQAIAQAIQLATANPEELAASINTLLSAASLPTLIDETLAKDHLRGNLIKEYAGQWNGTFMGDDSGACIVTVSDSGNISGQCSSDQLRDHFQLTGHLGSSGESAAGDTQTGASFAGVYSRTGAVSGTWSNQRFTNSSGTPYQGTWNFKKL